jgi:hypothetical protein
VKELTAVAAHQLTDTAKVHNLLFRALLEIRSQGFEQQNKLVYHLADLFHQVVLEMKNAADRHTTYEAVFQSLEQRAREKGLEKWLQARLEGDAACGEAT